MLGTGMLTNSRPLRPIISPLLMYLRNCWRTLPRTICRNRDRSRSILRAIGHLTSPLETRAILLPKSPGFRAVAPDSLPVLGISSGKDACHILQHVGGGLVVVTVIANQPTFHNVDFHLRVGIDNL